MKNILITIVCLATVLVAHAQGANCLSMEPICTDYGASFPASTNTTSEVGNDYGCLGSQPNPAWYYFEISANGNIDMELNGNGFDVDFIIWGPFNDLSDAQSNCGNLTAGQIVDCSYSATTVEDPSIPGAQVGEVYIMLITNFSNQPTQIDLDQTGGSGATDCSIVNPCEITNLTAVPSACDPATDLYSLSGSITFATPPTTGTLTVSNSCGGSQVFNAPFASPLNYSITGLTSNGAACTVTATFSDDVTCTLSTNYNAPASCVPPPCDISDLTAVPTACDPATDLYDLSGTITFSAPPTTGTLTVTNSCGGSQVFNAPFASPLNYSITGLTSNGAACTVTATFSDDVTCTLSTNYNAPASCVVLPCDITGVTATPGNCLAGNTYDVTGSIDFVNPPGSGTLTVSSSCGGSQVFNAPFASPIAYSLNGLSANGATCTVTAEFSVGSCSETQNYTSPAVPVTDAGADQEVCEGTAVTLSASGATSYVWDNGVTDGVPFVPSTTTIYTVTGSNAAGCSSTDQVEVTVNPLPNVFAGNDVTVCSGESVTLTGSGAVSYVWDNNVTNGVSFMPSIGTTTYTVIGTDANGCQNTDEVDVTMNPTPVVDFISDVSNGCSPLDVEFTLQSTPGVTCEWNFGDGSTGSGCGSVTHTYSGIGCYDVTMTTTDANGCVGSTTYDDFICVAPDPVASFFVSPSNLNTLDPEGVIINQSSGATSYTWYFGDGSEPSSQTSPIHTWPAEQPGTYTVMLVAENSAGCKDTAYFTVEVEDIVIFYLPNSFTPDDDVFNDLFKPVFTSGYDPFDFELLIFDRWGEIIWESHDASVGWDGTYHGKPVPDGTYSWKIQFKQTMDDEHRMVMGHVNVIR